MVDVRIRSASSLRSWQLTCVWHAVAGEFLHELQCTSHIRSLHSQFHMCSFHVHFCQKACSFLCTIVAFIIFLPKVFPPYSLQSPGFKGAVPYQAIESGQKSNITTSDVRRAGFVWGSKAFRDSSFPNLTVVTGSCRSYRRRCWTCWTKYL